jgi:23S rRNA pseudouridine2605 synthase
MAERIQKVLANAGAGSRREIERWVAEGRLTIDGRRAAPGDQLKGRERVCLDGRPLRYTVHPGRREQSFLAYHKPSDPRRSHPGSSHDEIVDVPRPKRGRWIAVGGVDPGTSGLIVLTTDGQLADRLSRPGAAVEREYAVRLLGELAPAQEEELTTGVELDDGTARVEAIEPAGGTGSNVWYHVWLHDGRHRHLRPMFGAVGVALSRVMLVRYGPIALGPLKRGESRELAEQEIGALYQAAGLEAGHTPESGDRARRRPSKKSRPGQRRILR